MRTARAVPTPWRVQEDHDLANDLLRFPGLHHAAVRLGPMPSRSCQALRGLLNDVKHLLAKGLHQFSGKVRANAFDHARAQILLDAFQRTGWDDAELLAS